VPAAVFALNVVSGWFVVLPVVRRTKRANFFVVNAVPPSAAMPGHQTPVHSQNPKFEFLRINPMLHF